MRFRRLFFLTSSFALFVVCLAGGASARHGSQAATPQKQTGAAVLGWARLSARTPLRGAHVTLETLSGKPIASSDSLGRRFATTNASGGFDVHAVRLPSRFVVVATGGVAAGKKLKTPLRAVVARRAVHQLVHINLLTTLAAARDRRHPFESSAATAARIQRLLAVPGWHTIDRDVSFSPQYFDGIHFASYARAHGGLGRYMTRLRNELELRHPPTHHFAGTAPTLPQHSLRGVAGATQAADAGSFILEGLAKGALGGIGNDLFGDVLVQVGLASSASLSGLSGQLKDVRAQLGTIETSIITLQGAVQTETKLIASAEYTSLAANLNIPRGQIDTAFDALLWIADNKLTSSAADVNSKVGVVEAESAVLRADPNVLDDSIGTGAPAAGNILTSAQQMFYENLKSTSPLVSGDALSSLAVAVESYYSGYEGELATLLVEGDNVQGLSSSLINADIANSQGHLAAWQSEIVSDPPPLTFVDLRTGLMWSFGNTNCAVGGGALWSATAAGFNAPDPFTPLSCGGPNPLYGDFGGSDLSFSYEPPSIEQLQSLVAGWNNTSPAPTNVLTWFASTVGPGVGMPYYGSSLSLPFTQGPYGGRSGSYGSVWNLWTNSCTYDNETYTFNGVASSLDDWSSSRAGQFTYCALLSLTDGSTVNECVADRENNNAGDGCETALDPTWPGYDYDGAMTMHPCAPCGPLPDGTTLSSGFQLDYFHPNMMLAERTPVSPEQYWISP